MGNNVLFLPRSPSSSELASQDYPKTLSLCINLILHLYFHLNIREACILGTFIAALMHFVFVAAIWDFIEIILKTLNRYMWLNLAIVVRFILLGVSIVHLLAVTSFLTKITGTYISRLNECFILFSAPLHYPFH